LHISYLEIYIHQSILHCSMSSGFGSGGGGDKPAAGTKPPFAFGTSASAGGFGFGQAAPSASLGSSAAAPFSFGSATAASAPKAADATAAFSFGAGVGTSNAPSFTAAATAGGGITPGPALFAFGGLSSAASGGKSTAPTAPAGFEAGAGEKETSSTTEPFSFSSSNKRSSAGNNSVGFGATTASNKPPDQAADDGFSFGGGSASVPTPNPDAFSIQGSTAAHKRASSGATFGGAVLPATGGSPQATSGFGTSSPPTPATPAPVGTPAQPGPSAGASSVLQPQQQSSEPPQLEYQTLTVEQIINKFQQELERDAMLFLEEARRVAEYDAILRDSQRDIAKLTQQTHRTLIEQSELEQTLIGIAAFQDELQTTLETVEGHVDELFAAQSTLAPVDADMEREQAYSTASLVEQRLQALSSALHNTLAEIEETQERVLTGDVGKIVKILNQHETSLAEIQAAGRRMEQDIGQVSKLLSLR
jgi:nuclear pore complex protein Nup62